MPHDVRSEMLNGTGPRPNIHAEIRGRARSDSLLYDVEENDIGAPTYVRYRGRAIVNRSPVLSGSREKR